MKECPICKTKYRDDDYYCKKDNYPLKTIENSPELYFDSFEEQSKKHLNEIKSNKHNIECPYCHSTNTRKITTGSKIGSVAIFGLFAMGKATKEWHCNNCKSNF